MRKKMWLIVVICLLAVALGAAGLASQYIWAEGAVIKRSATHANLQGKDISAETYEQLQQKLPNCELIWDVPFQGGRCPSNTTTLKVSSLTDEDVQTLKYFPMLSRLDGTQCSDYAQLQQAADAYPDLLVLWQVSLNATAYDQDTQQLMLKDPDVAELMQMLPWLPELTLVELSGQLPDSRDLEQLRQTFPQVQFQWELDVAGRRYTTTDTAMDLSNIPMTCEEASALLRYFPYDQTVDMRGCGLTDAEMMLLAEENPGDHFLWDITIGDKQYFTGAEEIDISGTIVEDLARFESLLPLFPNLKKVIMCECGIDDETMDALNKRYDNIRFVWTVKISYGKVRTDTEFFYPFKISRYLEVDDEDLYPLRYCTDIVAVDIGHMWDVTNCEWAAYMPKLKYLILAESSVSDLSPLANCKELAYLEIFLTPVKDYSPLLECKKLVDLNCCYTFGDHTAIAQMTWLENLWWSGVTAIPNAVEDLEKSLTNTNLQFYKHNLVGNNGWRKLDNYKRMRDVMGMFYLK